MSRPQGKLRIPPKIRPSPKHRLTQPPLPPNPDPIPLRPTERWVCWGNAPLISESLIGGWTSSPLLFRLSLTAMCSCPQASSWQVHRDHLLHWGNVTHDVLSSVDLLSPQLPPTAIIWILVDLVFHPSPSASDPQPTFGYIEREDLEKFSFSFAAFFGNPKAMTPGVRVHFTACKEKVRPAFISCPLLAAVLPRHTGAYTGQRRARPPSHPPGM